MKSESTNQLFFEYLQVNAPASAFSSYLSEKKTRELANRGVSSIFIVTSKVVHSEYYLQLIHFFRESGFKVHTFYIDSIGENQVKNVKNAVERIYQSFEDGNCYVLSYGWSYALSIVTAFYLYTGKSLADSLAILGEIRSRIMQPQEDMEFLSSFEKHIRPVTAEITEPRRAPLKKAVEKKGERTAAIEKDTDKAEQKTLEPRGKEKLPEPLPKTQKDKKAEKPAKQPAVAKTVPEEDQALSDEEYMKLSRDFMYSAHADPFYRSLKFKLISIISAIIVVSMSGMISIATHFFKNDNEIRVQENNLKFSEIIASKVKSELDKSIVIASTMLKDNSSGGDKMDYLDSDILFSGIIRSKKLHSPVQFDKQFYNMPIMQRYLLPDKKIRDIHNRSIKIFTRSFNGETVIQNVSQGLETPVMLLSKPYRIIRGRPVTSVLVVYMKLDNLLKVFQTTGIIEPFMVNDRGDIIAHPDGKIVLSTGNLASLPIVDRMLKSSFDNSQTRYSDKNNAYYLASFKKLGLAGCGVIATVEEDIAFQEVYNIRRRNIYLMIIMLSAAILIVFFFGRSITTPIIRLVAATQQIIQGNYHINIRPTTRDEIGELTYSFIEMGKGLEEREKIKSAFGKFVNKEIAEAAMRDELRLGGERKNVAIFFSDIRSFTAISEQLEPEEVVEFLNEYMTRMVKCVEQFNGVVDKFIGDAIMAIWGTPISKGNDTENAIDSALFMRKELIEFNRDRGGSKKPLIHIGCGINTGPVLAGQIGSEDRMEYTVIGDAVNLASRIEALNKPFGTDILISEDSFRLVNDIYACEKMQTIKVKGKEEPQQIYAVLGRLDNPDRFKSLEELRRSLSMKPQPFNRRSSDRDGSPEDEKKYEIINE